jgi:hypothetical protein
MSISTPSTLRRLQSTWRSYSVRYGTISHTASRLCPYRRPRGRYPQPYGFDHCSNTPAKMACTSYYRYPSRMASVIPPPPTPPAPPTHTSRRATIICSNIPATFFASHRAQTFFQAIRPQTVLAGHTAPNICCMRSQTCSAGYTTPHIFCRPYGPKHVLQATH